MIEPLQPHANLGRRFPFMPRRKRHVRSPRDGFEITEHDIALLAAVVRFRLLSTPQAATIDPRNADVVGRRLRDLYDHGLLDRPLTELARLFRMRNAPGIYAITNRGARLLREARALLPAFADREIDWATLNDRLSDAGFIEHTLKTTNAVLAFARHAERHRLGMSDHHQLLAAMPEATQRLVLPFRVQAVIDADDRDRYGKSRLRGVAPDRLLSFSAPNREPINLALEIDNGTMPELRSSFEQSSIVRKVAVYHTAQREGSIRTQWGFRPFFVAFITTTPERAIRTCAAQQRYLDDKGSRTFLFTDQATFAARDPFSAIWRNGRGERQSLLRWPQGHDDGLRQMR